MKLKNSDSHDLRDSINFDETNFDSMPAKHTLTGKLAAFNQKSEASPSKRNGNHNMFLTKQLERLNNFLNNISTKNNLPLSKVEDNIEDENSSTPYSVCEFNAFEEDSIPDFQQSSKELNKLDTNSDSKKAPSSNDIQAKAEIPRNLSHEFQKSLKGVIRVTSDYFNQDGDQNDDLADDSNEAKNHEDSNTDTVLSKNLNKLFKSGHSEEIDDSSDNVSDLNKISVS